MEEAGQLHAELEELCQLLHKSQERENLAMEQVETARNEVENLQDELKKLEVEHEYAQTKLELDSKLLNEIDVNGRRRRRNC